MAEALIATAAGLLIAILTLIPYNYFSNRAERELEEIEYYGSRLELLLAEQEGRPAKMFNRTTLRKLIAIKTPSTQRKTFTYFLSLNLWRPLRLLRETLFCLISSQFRISKVSA